MEKPAGDMCGSGQSESKNKVVESRGWRCPGFAQCWLCRHESKADRTACGAKASAGAGRVLRTLLAYAT